MRTAVFLLCVLLVNAVFCQDIPVEEVEQQLEELADKTEEPSEDDSWMQMLDYYKHHPLNLNTVSAEELKQLLILSPIQINNFIRYRELLGALIHINELQAVPGWDPVLIRKLIPYISINDAHFSLEKFKSRFTKGEYQLLVRTSRRWNSADENPTATKYAGGPQSVLLRFQYRQLNLIQYGMLAEKDAGEALWGRKGIDFYSIHFFVRNAGIFKRLAVGDYVLKLGQGLIQWQGLANKKNANVLMIKQEDEILKPYQGSGEFNFHRGLGLSIQKKRWELTVFTSARKLSGNVELDSSSVPFISSISSSGYHRTTTEIENKNKLSQYSTGGNLSYAAGSLKLALNFIQFQYSIPINKNSDPYQLYQLKGKSFFNWSSDYAYTFRNLHLFGELAFDQHMNSAFLSGILVSLDKRLDLSVNFRRITPSYQSINASAFTENSSPSNETGVYSGISFRLARNWQLEAYADIYYFPWLKFRVDAPSRGKDYFVQVTYQPNKRLQIQTRFKAGIKDGNVEAFDEPLRKLGATKKIGWRVHANWQATRKISLAHRVEVANYMFSANESGILSYVDCFFNPVNKPYQFNGRLQYFETDGYNSRIYSFERDVLFSYSIPAFQGTGFSYYLNFHIKMNRIRGKILRCIPADCWLKWAQSLSHRNDLSTNVINQITPTSNATLTFQLRYSL